MSYFQLWLSSFQIQELSYCRQVMAETVLHQQHFAQLIS